MAVNQLRLAHTRWQALMFSALIIITVGIKFGSPKIQRLYYEDMTHEISQHSYACPGKEIILQCSRIGETISWTVTTDSVGRIVYFSSDPEGRIINQGIIRGVLLQNDRLSDGSNLRNFTTQLHVYTAQLTRSMNITCSSDDGSSTHVIAPSATPQNPVLKEPQLFQQEISNTTTRYYLEWEVPSNSSESDLDRYLLYLNDNLIQNIQANQRYAVIKVDNTMTNVIKVAAADTCGQVSNFSSIIIPLNNNIIIITSNPGPETNSVDDNIGTDQRYSNSIHSIASLVLIVCTTFLALLTQSN